jgi:flagellin
MVVTPTDPDDTAGTAVTALTGGNDSTAVLGTVRLSSDKTFTVTPGNAANIFSAATTALSSSLTQLGNITLKTVNGATNALAVLDTSLAMVASSRSSLGAIQNRLTSTVDNLNNIIAKTEQSRAQIVDADYASETTALSKSQILQQASTAMLAQANKANQGVLTLLQG